MLWAPMSWVNDSPPSTVRPPVVWRRSTKLYRRAGRDVAVSLPAISAWLRLRRPGFAPPRLREEALLVMVALGLSMAALPGISEGWHAAVNLSVQGGPADPGPSAAMPGWTLIVASAALVCGGLFSLWSRR